MVRDNVGMAKLKTDVGVKEITDELDKLFLKDKNQAAYISYQNFIEHKRAHDSSIKEYIFDFEKLYNKVKKNNMVLPDGVLAYHVLNGANLSSKDSSIVKATMLDDDFTYENMVKKLKYVWR